MDGERTASLGSNARASPPFQIFSYICLKEMNEDILEKKKKRTTGFRVLMNLKEYILKVTSINGKTPKKL